VSESVLLAITGHLTFPDLKVNFSFLTKKQAKVEKIPLGLGKGLLLLEKDPYDQAGF
jgi:hypothetical protein